MHEVRWEEPRDFHGIRVVHERAFAPSREEADLVEALRASGAHVPELCLVAVRGDEGEDRFRGGPGPHHPDLDGP